MRIHTVSNLHKKHTMPLDTNQGNWSRQENNKMQWGNTMGEKLQSLAGS